MEKKEYVQVFFEQPDKYLRNRFAIQIRKKIIAGLIEKIKHSDVLDVGCGDGSLTIDLLDKSRVTFLDASSAMLNILKKRVKENINARIIKSFVDQYHTQEQYDLIVCVGLLAHVQDISSTLLHLKSMLNKEGHLIIQYTDHDHLLNKLYYMGKKSNKYIHKTSELKMNSLFVELGFRVDQQIKYNIMFRGMGRLPDPFLYWIQSQFIDSKFFEKFLMENMVVLSKISK